MGPSFDATNPPLAAELVHAAKLLGDAGDTEGAVRAWRRVLAVEPDNLRAHQHLAAFAYHGDLPSEALGHLEAVVAGLPDDLPAWRRIAHLFELVGDFRRAAAAYGQVVRLAPSDAAADALARAAETAERDRAAQPVRPPTICVVAAPV